jgi:hypothetical protein
MNDRKLDELWKNRRRTEVRIQKAETNTTPTQPTIKPTDIPTQDRISIIETQKEDTEQEIECLYETLNKIKELKDKTKANTTAKQELQAFIKRLEKQIEINTGILDEYIQSIEFIKNTGTQALKDNKSETLLPPINIEDKQNDK